MRLFGYYAVRSFVNQLKKLLKTWVLVFLLACMVLGGVIGFAAASLSDLAEDNRPETTEAAEPGTPGLLERLDLEVPELVELAAGAAVLLTLVLMAAGADKNGSKLFLPADVNLLFPSPLSPQSVLLFRLTARLGTALLASVYLLLQLPNLIHNAGLSLFAALSLIAAWGLTIMTGTLLQVLLYLLCSAHRAVRTNLRRVIYGLLFLLAAAFLLFWRRSGLAPLKAAVAFFCSPASRLVPLWGWLKALPALAMAGKPGGAALALAAVLAGDAALLLAIRRTRADFYEDALAKSQETAELLERQQAENASGAFRRRKKDRSERIRRDDFNRGAGANVFFYKTLYNRARFAHLGFLTKTAEAYLALTLALGLLQRLFLHTDALLILALVLAGLSFFRALGNPLEQDTGMPLFLLVPESAWRKLFWSLLGGTVNCLLDVLPAMILAVFLLPADPVTALAWIPFIVSVDFYATTVGAFIGLSMPVHAGKMVKQLVQILFIYFGLLPDAALLAVGVILGHTGAAAVLAALVNLALGLVFFALSPLFLEPGARRAQRQSDAPDPAARREARRRFSRVGWALLAFLALGSAAQILAAGAGARLLPDWGNRPWLQWALTFAPLYLIGLPPCLLLLRRIPAAPPEQTRLSPGRLGTAAVICVFLLYAGNLAGTGVNLLLQSLLDLPAGNPLLSYALDESPALKILFLVLLAPAVEELVFRRQLIDRLRGYGEALAVVTSAALFALFHGNFAQLFYAFALGLAFGYVYLRTGRLRYSLGLHMGVNLLGSVAGPALLEHADLSALEAIGSGAAADPLSLLSPGLVLFLAYAVALLALALAGLVLLCANVRRLRFDPAERELPRGSRLAAAWGNPGILVFTGVCLALAFLTAAA